MTNEACIRTNRGAFSFEQAAGALPLALLLATLHSSARADVPFLRGDVNQDGQVTISDIDFYLWCGFECWLTCLDAADVDDNGQIELTDAIRILNKVFLEGIAPIPAPFPEPGLDPTEDSLGCASYEVRAALVTDDLLELGHVSGRPGDHVSVPLSLRNAEGVTGFQIVVRYDPGVFTPLLPQAVSDKAPYFAGTVFDPATGSARIAGSFFGGSAFPEEGILRLGFKPALIEPVEIPPSTEPVPILNVLGVIPEDAEANKVAALSFTEQASDLGLLHTEVVSAGSLLGETRVPATLRDGSITVVPRVRFIRGDSNLDGVIEISDAIRTLSFLFLGGVDLSCVDASDVDDDGAISLSDSIQVLGFLFLGTRPPAAPWPACGEDENKDDLGCAAYPGC